MISLVWGISHDEIEVAKLGAESIRSLRPRLSRRMTVTPEGHGGSRFLWRYVVETGGIVRDRDRTEGPQATLEGTQQQVSC